MSGEMPIGEPPKQPEPPKAPDRVREGRFSRLLPNTFRSFLEGVRGNRTTASAGTESVDSGPMSPDPSEASITSIQLEPDEAKYTSDGRMILSADQVRAFKEAGYPMGPERPRETNSADIVRVVREAVTLEFIGEILGLSPEDVRADLNTSGVEMLSGEEQSKMLENIRLAEEQKMQQQGSRLGRPYRNPLEDQIKEMREQGAY